MDPSYLERPKEWSAKQIGIFMCIIGPISSIFDVSCFLFCWFHYGYQDENDRNDVRFQTCWFLVGLLTQTTIVREALSCRFGVI